LLQKWHPDKWAQNPGGAAEAKRRFQQIQEAYSGEFEGVNWVSELCF